jgi:hypothetical protein
VIFHFEAFNHGSEGALRVLDAFLAHSMNVTLVDVYFDGSVVTDFQIT